MDTGTFFWAVFGFMAVVCAISTYSTYSASKLVKPQPFVKFQNNFLLVYLVSMAADWLQGPYVYALYEEYGYKEGDIGVLFIAGFGSSMVFGTIVGSVADKYGRKKNCVLFGIIYGISCITKHFKNFHILMFGRLTGGIATSLLFSAFESWMVSEHNRRQFPPELLSNTFSLATFGNGVIAIVAGLVAGFVADNFGLVAPFDTSLCLLILEIIIVSSSWTENYGDSRIQLQSGFSNAWQAIVSDQKVWLLGLIQSLFEGAMYIFVFKWTPSLNSAPGKIKHGVVFACFMICVMTGSALFKFLISKSRVENFSRGMFLVSTISLFVPVVIEEWRLRFASFCLFEVCCGIFWPSLGTMRSKYVPEEVRATVMNFFRVPLNMIVCAILLKTGTITTQTVFICCSILLALATVCQHRLFELTKALAEKEVQAALMTPATFSDADSEGVADS